MRLAEKKIFSSLRSLRLGVEKASADAGPAGFQRHLRHSTGPDPGFDLIKEEP
jgi:hypothetical protein